MENRWTSQDARAFDGPIAGCVYCSRLIGSDPSLVLHGGGNSSVKAPFHDITGHDIDAVYVKGSGWDMADIQGAGFAPLRLDRLLQLLELAQLSDSDMARELAAAKLDPAAPNPSVESLLHAFLPFPAVQHSHADVIISLSNLAHPQRLVRQVYGDDVVVIDYVKPGFDLARLVRTSWPQQVHAGTRGMVLLNHGLFTFGQDDKTAYDRHIDLVDTAERWLDTHAPRSVPVTASPSPQLPHPQPEVLADLRAAVSEAAGRPMILRQTLDQEVLRFVAREDLAQAAGSGPLTPDHVIRTKRVPLIGTDVAGYAADYDRYVRAHADQVVGELEPIDPAPRVILDPALGLLTSGATWSEASIARDIYQRTIPVIERAQDHLGGYQALPPAALFAVEYWELEQAKLRRLPPPAELSGQVALVTGAASGIGLACARELGRRGAVVVGVDLAESITRFAVGPGSLGIQADLTDPDCPPHLAARLAAHAGGVDIVVHSAGILGTTQTIAEYTHAAWQAVHDINMSAAAALFAGLYPLLARSPVGGRVVAIASKNVPAPGPGMGAYSTSKAALTQLVRVAALEWAADGIRVNAVHPDAVFDTGLWDQATLAARAAHYGISVEEYRRRNLLGMEVTSADVAATVTALCTNQFRATTGTAVPVDGGNERVI
ncbi:MAG: bifunctional aldolase/short-chain dehydrogenase [Euzebya sp.]